MSDHLVAGSYNKLPPHRRHTSMPLAGFKTAIRASERPQTHFLYREDSGVGKETLLPSTQKTIFFNFMKVSKHRGIN